MTPETIATILSMFVPLLIAALKKTAYAQYANAIIAVVVYVVFGVIACVASGQSLSDPNALVTFIGIFVGGGTIAYNVFWKNWGDPQVTAKMRG